MTRENYKLVGKMMSSSQGFGAAEKPLMFRVFSPFQTAENRVSRFDKIWWKSSNSGIFVVMFWHIQISFHVIVSQSVTCAYSHPWLLETTPGKNDRKNDPNWLILVLNDTWHYEKDCKNTYIFEQSLYFSWGE